MKDFDKLAKTVDSMFEATFSAFTNINLLMFKRLDGNKNPLPTYETPGSAGMDLRAHLSEPQTVYPSGTIIVPTGFAVAIRPGFEGQIRSRSGLAAKQKVFVLNSPGTIDSDYRGEIKIILTNASEEPFTVNPGDRIAQLVISPVTQMTPVEVDELGTTARGEGGFGSTGMK